MFLSFTQKVLDPATTLSKTFQVGRPSGQVFYNILFFTVFYRCDVFGLIITHIVPDLPMEHCTYRVCLIRVESNVSSNTLTYHVVTQCINEYIVRRRMCSMQHPNISPFLLRCIESNRFNLFMTK
jgi:hypothetical protein